jgi:hypothetical protein
MNWCATESYFCGACTGAPQNAYFCGEDSVEHHPCATEYIYWCATDEVFPTWWRRQPSSYCYGPIVQGRLLTHRAEGKHGDSPLRQGAGKSFWTLPGAGPRPLMVRLAPGSAPSPLRCLMSTHASVLVDTCWASKCRGL